MTGLLRFSQKIFYHLGKPIRLGLKRSPLCIELFHKRKVLHMWSTYDRLAPHGRFKGVLPAMAEKTFTDHRDIRRPVNSRQLPNTVKQDNSYVLKFFFLHTVYFSPFYKWDAASPEQFRDLRKTPRVPRCKDQPETSESVNVLPECGDD